MIYFVHGVCITRTPPKIIGIYNFTLVGEAPDPDRKDPPYEFRYFRQTLFLSVKRDNFMG